SAGATIRRPRGPRQARSRESLRKRLKAATEVLGQHGLEGTTIPRIADHAGLTPGAVYRRFHDKDALLESAILGILERQDERVRTGISTQAAAQIPLPVLAEQIIGGMGTGDRMNAPMLRAARPCSHARANTPFWTKASRLEVRAFSRVCELFLVHRKEIRHPDPRIAVTLALMMVVSTLFELVVTPQGLDVWKGMLPKDDQALKRELTRAFLRYLGAEPERGQPRVRRRTR